MADQYQSAERVSDDGVDLLELDDPKAFDEEGTHRYRDESVVCETDVRGYELPGDRNPLEIVVDATEGFIPLWGPEVTLRWRFQPQSMTLFVNPAAAEIYLRNLFALGLAQWADAAPVKFKEADEAWDFEIVVNPHPSCRPTGGCTLARAFFPDAGRHDLMIFPTMFDQSQEEREETMAHELGHVFGLRHFFAPVSETEWASKIFGSHNHFSIMNYGSASTMTQADRDDLAALYSLVWNGDLEEINGTPIRQVRPFSESRIPHPACV